MVYCGKPSRGCQMCRTRRIKCDETKPTCNQCAKSRRVCPGYKDDFDLVFRNETRVTERRARKSLDGKKANHQIMIPNQETVFRSGSLIAPDSNTETRITRTSPMALSVPVEQQAPCFFLSNFVLSPTDDKDTPRGYFDFLVPLMKSETPDSHLALAFSAAAMASMSNRPDTRMRGDIRQMAVAQYTKALKATNIALQSPRSQKTDQTLAAILMLGFFETITSENNSATAWYSHVDGAVQLVRMRGQKQLRTKVGQGLFQVVRTQMVINCMTSNKMPKGGADWWTSDIKDDLAAPITKMKILIAELRVEMNHTLNNHSRTPEYFQEVLGLMRRAAAIEQGYQAWEASLPGWWRPKTVAWVDNTAGLDLRKSEVCPGKIETHHNIWVSVIWNHARVLRIACSGVLVRCAAWMCSPVDYRTTPEYAHATRLCVDLITDIISSVPYHLGWDFGKGSALASADMAGFEAGLEAFHKPKPINGFFALWPLFVVSTADYATDSQRLWAKSRLNHIADILGMNHAKVLAGFQLRIPSMLIRRDNIGRQPIPSRGIPQVYTPPSLNPPPSYPQDVNNNFSTNANAVPPGIGQEREYTLNPLQQRALMQQEIFEKERLSLLSKASGEQGETIERLMARYLQV
ncbi:hypothetical protein BJ875DRAFT_161677 [Amylocarpus encephaloides]|uniref:Zn(2)-C6 fungal-type domain-containing protein n=1 Tax=Amylocarpus encephaloides TaxID=45428 RepID=A0A9P8C1F6_9HELO|nr:hypothetical protein BJ875DRAFT_161677 [Amylocarpus encephaloides]